MPVASLRSLLTIGETPSRTVGAALITTGATLTTSAILSKKPFFLEAVPGKVHDRLQGCFTDDGALGEIVAGEARWIGPGWYSPS